MRKSRIIGENIMVVFMVSDTQELKKKSKTTIYMDDEVERLLDEVYIKRIRDRNRTDRSALLCEGIRLLYSKEIEGEYDGK